MVEMVWNGDENHTALRTNKTETARLEEDESKGLIAPGSKKHAGMLCGRTLVKIFFVHRQDFVCKPSGCVALHAHARLFVNHHIQAEPRDCEVIWRSQSQIARITKTT